MGKRREHVILAQNCFCYSDGLYDIDYTAIPLPWTTSAEVLQKGYVNSEEAKVLLNSFTINQKAKSERKPRLTARRCAQRRLRNH